MISMDMFSNTPGQTESASRIRESCYIGSCHPESISDKSLPARIGTRMKTRALSSSEVAVVILCSDSKTAITIITERKAISKIKDSHKDDYVYRYQ